MACYKYIIRRIRPHRSQMQMAITATGNFVSGVLTIALACLGCAPTADWPKAHPDAMMVQKSRPIHMSRSRVIVTALGGQLPDSVLEPRITSEDFSQALRQSIEHSGLFAQAKKDGQASYALHASIAKVDHQRFASEATVSLEVNYTLTRTQPEEVVWEKVMTSTYTVQRYEAFGAVSHVHLATEGAARTNIEQVIQEISLLQLK